MSESSDYKETMAERSAEARRREVVLPTVCVALAFAAFLAAAIWAGFTCDEAMTRLSDSLVALLFILWTLVCLALILVNAMLIALLSELRKNLPEQLDSANERVRSAEPIVLNVLNRFSEPIISLIARINALFHIIRRS